MPTYLSSTACNGHCPSHVRQRGLVERPELLTRLMGERHVARFVVAPAGFGKTCLVAEYAKTVFSFKNVFWIKCDSPCFLRDLDAGAIAQTLLDMANASFLAVFEDVPPMDDERSSLFSRMLDGLISDGNEVIVTCVPSADAYGSLCLDRVFLGACDLLISDEELVREAPALGGARAMAPFERIAALHWGGANIASFLSGVIEERFSGNLALAFVVMLALERGEMEELCVYLAPDSIEEVAKTLRSSYPFMGVDEHFERYCALPVDLEQVLVLFKPLLLEAAFASSSVTQRSFPILLADSLMARKRMERACVVVRCLATKTEAAAWLAKRGFSLVMSGCVYPTHQLNEYIGRKRGTFRFSLGLIEALRLLELGDESAGASMARRIALAVSVGDCERIACCLIMLALGAKDSHDRAEAALRSFVSNPRFLEGPASSLSSEAVFSCESLEVLARLGLALEWGIASALSVMEELLVGDATSSETIDLASYWLLACLRKRAEEGSTFKGDERQSRTLMRMVRRLVERFDEEGSSVSLPLVRAGSELRRLLVDDGLPEPLHLPARIDSLLSECEVRRYRQAMLYREEIRAKGQRSSDYGRIHHGASQDRARRAHDEQGSSIAYAPVLKVRLMGGFNVSLGPDAIDPSLLSRHKTKMLLALLILRRGMEASRDSLARMLWPESDIEPARRNFYSVWSQLRRALTLDDRCPYLIRDQNSCRLEQRLVTCDVFEIDSVCRRLMFDDLSNGAWVGLIREVREDFPGDLLPSEFEIDEIVRRRDELRTRLVDALIEAASRLLDDGESRGALWFARESVARDPAREDAYAMLMECQIAAGQRSKAVETYFQCRRYLNDELGIDPSPSLVSMYRRMIQSEEELPF